VAFAIAAVLFGLAHCYQGWKGVLMTTLLGVVFTALYVAISRLWVVMALHALIDLNALLLQPLIFRRFKPAAL
jgi:membrane protease YdiL (CAAX protease family)